jgi:RNA polymerase sigma-70 factor (ECF subfamily)
MLFLLKSLQDSIVARDSNMKKRYSNEEIEKYRDRILFFIRKRIGYVTDAEDICHDVLLALFEANKEGRLENVNNIPAYIFKIAKNKLIDWLRKKKVKLPLNERLPDLTVMDYESRELSLVDKDLLTKILLKLPKDKQQLVKWRFYAGYTYEDLQLKTGKSNAALRKIFSRIMEKLRKELPNDFWNLVT